MAFTSERHKASKIFTPGPARRIIAPQQRHQGKLSSAATIPTQQSPSETQDSLFDGSTPSSWISSQDTQTVSREEYEEGERLRLEQKRIEQRLRTELERPPARSPVQPPQATDILRSDIIPSESSSQQYLERALRSNEKRDRDDPDYDETQYEQDVSTSRDYITRSRRSGLGIEDIQLLDESDDVMDFENTPDIDSSIPSKRRSPSLTSPRSTKKSKKPITRSPRPEVEHRLNANHNERTQSSTGALFVSQSTTVPNTQESLNHNHAHSNRVQSPTLRASATPTPEPQRDPVSHLLSQAETQTQTDFQEAAQIWRREDSNSSQNLSHLSLQDSIPAPAPHDELTSDLTSRTDDQLIKDLGTARKLEQAAKEVTRKALLAEKEAIERREKIWSEMQRRFACASPNRRSP